MRKSLLFTIWLSVAASTAFGQEVESDNSEMARIFEADQAVRREFSSDKAREKEFVGRMIAEDKARRIRTAQLVQERALTTANDFYRAAFIYQHGGEPSSYLVAHTLAVVAAARGHDKAGWIAAATLDRYLQSIDRPQIYGTQTSISTGQKPSKEPFDRVVIPDSLRAALGVPSLAAQGE